MSSFEDAAKAAEQAMAKMKQTHHSTYEHSMNVRAMTSDFLNFLSDEVHLEPCFEREVILSAMTHDIGKMGVPETIISAGCNLTEPEKQIMHDHTLLSKQFMPKDHLSMQMDVALHHHDDYRNGLSLPVQIIAVCDTFCALTEARSYKAAVSTEEALKIMRTSRRNQNLNPNLVDRLAEMQKERMPSYAIER